MSRTLKSAVFKSEPDPLSPPLASRTISALGCGKAGLCQPNQLHHQHPGDANTIFEPAPFPISTPTATAPHHQRQLRPTAGSSKGGRLGSANRLRNTPPPQSPTPCIAKPPFSNAGNDPRVYTKRRFGLPCIAKPHFPSGETPKMYSKTPFFMFPSQSLLTPTGQKKGYV